MYNQASCPAERFEWKQGVRAGAGAGAECCSLGFLTRTSMFSLYIPPQQSDPLPQMCTDVIPHPCVQNNPRMQQKEHAEVAPELADIYPAHLKLISLIQNAVITDAEMKSEIVEQLHLPF